MKGQDMRSIELFVEQPKACQHSAFLRSVIDPPPVPLHASSSAASQHSAMLGAVTGAVTGSAADACVLRAQNGTAPNAHRYIYYTKSLCRHTKSLCRCDCTL